MGKHQASSAKRAYNSIGRRLPTALRRRWLYAGVHGRLPRFSEPQSFSDKVNWRILHDRRPELAWTCDKLAMKEHALASGAAVRVPETLWVGTDVRELADVDLPGHWVIKPAHRSGIVHFGDATTDLEALAALTRSWLDDVQSSVMSEWAYGQAQRVLLVEELLGEPGHPPTDYKFFVFDGVPAMIQVDLDRFTDHERSLYTPDWRLLDVTLGPHANRPVPRPGLLPEMLDAAAKLATGFDFMRIDLYALPDGVAFGEYTPYPVSGLQRFVPAAHDYELGAKWLLPPLATVRPGAVRGA